MNDGDRSAARELVCSSIETMNRGRIDDMLEAAERSPAFSLPFRLLARVAAEVLDQADKEQLEHAAALEIFAMRLYSRRSVEVALVDRALAEELRLQHRRRIVGAR